MCAPHLAHRTSVRTRSGFLISNNKLVPDLFMVDMDFGFVFYEWILVFDFFFWKMNVSRQTNAYDLVMPA